MIRTNDRFRYRILQTAMNLKPTPWNKNRSFKPPSGEHIVIYTLSHPILVRLESLT